MDWTFYNDKGQNFNVWMNRPNADVLLEALNKTEARSSNQFWSLVTTEEYINKII